MKDLNLPRFEIPRTPAVRFPPGRYWAWVMENILRAHKAGSLGRLRDRPDRLPVDARFELK